MSANNAEHRAMQRKMIRSGRGERVGWLSTYREDRVSILVRFTPSSMTAEQYDVGQ